MSELLAMIESVTGDLSGSAGWLVLVGAAIGAGALLVTGLWARPRARREAPLIADAGRRGLGEFVGPYRAPLVVSMALALTIAILELAAPWPLKLAVDHAIGGQPLSGPLAPLTSLSPGGLAAVAALAGVGLVGLGGVLRYLESTLVGAASEQIVAAMRCAAFERLMHLPLRFHDRHRTGDLVARLMSDVPRVQDALVAVFNTLVPNGLALIGMLAILFALDVRIALAALAVLPALAGQIVLSRARIKAAERDARDKSGALASRATEVVRQVRAVQAFSREREEGGSFRQESAGAARSAITALDVHARYSPVSDLILSLGAAVVLFMGIQRVLAGDLTVGVLLVVLTYVASFYHPVRSLTRLTSILARAAASRERLLEILASGEALPEDPSAVPAPPAPSALAFHRVTFSYRPDSPVLRDVELEVPAGRTVCLVGPTGAGKSTLLSLALRLHDPAGGAVTLGGIDLRRLTLGSLRQRMAFVPQDAWILDGTVAENIRFGRPEATDEDVRRAAGVALVEEFASRLPDGYATRVGEGGAFLSGGQRRRIALARAVLRDAQVLLLDEPTSGLDAESETAVIRALQRAAEGRTALIVSHRLRIAAIADRVAVLRGGRVVEDGLPDELLAACGDFARLWEEQALPDLDRLPVQPSRQHVVAWEMDRPSVPDLEPASGPAVPSLAAHDGRRDAGDAAWLCRVHATPSP